MEQHTEKFLRQRRFIMALPILVAPFLVMLFWALGGGQGSPAQAAERPSGLNMELPDAHFGKNETELWDKFSLYEQAKRDSMKYEEARRADPYYAINPLVSSDTTPERDGKLMTSLGKKAHEKTMQEQEKLINKKLEALSQFVNTPAPSPPMSASTPVPQEPALKEKSAGPDQQAIERLEKMMTVMASSNTEDTEMKQIDGMLDKILAIQNPEYFKADQQAKAPQETPKVYAVEPVSEDEISSLEQADMLPTRIITDSLIAAIRGRQEAVQEVGFYGLDDEGTQDHESNTIPAVIHETQTIVAGANVKMRLLTDVMINGTLVKANELVYGVCQLQGERLIIKAASIHSAGRVLPVTLSAYDIDGIEGLHIPGAISRDVAKQAAGKTVQGVNLFTMDTSLGAQAAVAGVEAAKGLFSKKAKLIAVTVKAGYQVLLVDGNQKKYL